MFYLSEIKYYILCQMGENMTANVRMRLQENKTTLPNKLRDQHICSLMRRRSLDPMQIIFLGG